MPAISLGSRLSSSSSSRTSPSSSGSSSSSSDSISDANSSSSDSSSSSTTSSSESDIDFSDAEVLDAQDDGKRVFVVEVDDETDEDIMAVLWDAGSSQDGVSMCNAAFLPTAADVELDPSISRPALVSFVHRVKLDCRRETRLNIEFANLLRHLYASLRSTARSSGGDRVTSVEAKFTIPSEATLEMTVTALVRSTIKTVPLSAQLEDAASDDGNDGELSIRDLGASPAAVVDAAATPPSVSWFKRRLPLPRLFRGSSKATGSPAGADGAEVDIGRTESPRRADSFKQQFDFELNVDNAENRRIAASEAILLTPRAFVDSGRVVRYLGRLNLHFIKESSSLRDGVQAFFKTFLAEMNTIARAHVKSLGGNALLSYQLARGSRVARRTRTRFITSYLSAGILCSWSTTTMAMWRHVVTELLRYAD